MNQHKNPHLARQQRMRADEKQRQPQLHRLLQEAEPQFIRLLQRWLEQEKPSNADINRSTGNKR